MCIRDRQYTSQLTHDPQTSIQQSTDAIERVQRALLNYMKEKRLTFYDMYVQMDKNRNKYITKQEFKTFLDTRVALKLTDIEFKTVWDFFDESPDGKLSVKEFNDSLKKKAWGQDSKRQLFEQQARESLQLNSSLVSRILEQINQKIKKENKSFSILFSEIDKNNDGTISQDELQEYIIKELELTLTFEDFDQLFRRFDGNYDDCISITEFKKVFEEEKEKYDRIQAQQFNAELVQSVQFDNNFVKATHIPPKFFDYLRQNSTKFFIICRTQSPNTVLIDKQQFSNLLKDQFSIFIFEESKINPSFRQIELSDIQIDSMIGYTQSGNQQNQVNYEKFTEFFKEAGREDQLYKRIKEDSQTKQLAQDTFKRINNMLKKKNISQKEFFRIMDLNKDNRLNFYELQTAFTQMQLKIPKYDAEQIFQMLDINHTGEILFDEFQKQFIDLTSN
eukprot:TRINITY_DN10987_c0_g1_i2.p1 TRINITY_DN10987_c0_g1~~TRINITY_DN10987_c0_g1_i2.p1  ORF type:complete len:459 (-),score=83.30 TRINITY_DN10987_c0_g1_i2:185-1528(-)